MLTTALLAISLLGAPQSNCTAPTQTGIFRITAVSKDGKTAKLGMILLENVSNCLEATIITDNAGPAIMDELSVAGDTLTARLRFPTGAGKVTLHLTPTSIAGSIVEGKHEWQVSGRRTSGADSRVALNESR